MTALVCPWAGRRINKLTKGKQVWTAGQVIGLIHDIPTVAELISRIEKEAQETLKDKLALIKPASKL